MTLPGAFCLPIILLKEDYYIQNDEICEIGLDIANDRLVEYMNYTILDQMISGRIVSTRFIYLREDGSFCGKFVYICDEMIGRSNTKGLSNYGKNN